MTDLKELLRTAMDLETTAHSLVAELEKRISVPKLEHRGVTIRYLCKCGQPVGYPDKFCRECGRMQEW